MRVTVDIASVLEIEKRARVELRTVPREMEKIAKRAAKHSREQHRYQNRTGRTEASTYGYLVESTADGATVEIGIDVPHAPYLMEGGTIKGPTRGRDGATWTSLEEAVEQAERDLDAFMSRIGQ